MNSANGRTGNQPALLKIKNATVIRNGQRVLDHISLEIHEGEHTAILGPNGSGKSSLIKLVTFQHYALAHKDGTPPVQVFGKDLWDVFHLRTMLGIVSADLHHTFTAGVSLGRLRGLEAVFSGFFASYGLIELYEVTPAMEEQAWRAIRSVGAEHLANRWIDEMSTGEVRRILIARALVADPRALMLDEPTTGLDLVARQRFLQTVQHIAQQGKTIILVTHHLEEVLPDIQRVILLSHGHIMADGPKQQVLTDERMSAMFEAPIRVEEHGGYYSAVNV